VTFTGRNFKFFCRTFPTYSHRHHHTFHLSYTTFREMMGLNKVGERPLILDSWGKEREDALAKKKAKRDAIPSYVKVYCTRS
jgi:hypothetical protein